MKEICERPDPVTGSEIGGPGAESEEKNIIVGSEYGQENFYHFPGDELFGLVAFIKKWESIRYTT